MRKQKTKKIFISYAREDIDTARQIYHDLKKFGLDVWFDEECLLPGKNWDREIQNIIPQCAHFLALLSSNSVNKHGYVQKELKKAFEVLDKFPEGYEYIIPVRLNDCKLLHEKLQMIQYADIFPVDNYDKGLYKILLSIGIVRNQAAARGKDFSHLRIFEEQQQELQQALETQRQDLQTQITELSKRINKKEADERELAQSLIQDTKALLSFIKDQQRHKKFKPGTVEKIQAEMIVSENIFKKGVYHIAVTAALQSYVKASELRLEIGQLEEEWNVFWKVARKNANDVQVICNEQESYRLTLETEGDSTEIAARIDFWTDGALSDFKKKVHNELKRLDRADDLSLDQLKASIRRSEEWRDECLRLVEKAKQAIIASQLRNNMAQIIAITLRASGWEISDSTYEGEDHRGAMHLKLENYNGDEIVIIITPEMDETEALNNKLNVFFFDRSSNDETYRQERLKTIVGALQEECLECSEPRSTAVTENNLAKYKSKLDFMQIRQAKLQTHTSQKSGH